MTNTVTVPKFTTINDRSDLTDLVVTFDTMVTTHLQGLKKNLFYRRNIVVVQHFAHKPSHDGFSYSSFILKENQCPQNLKHLVRNLSKWKLTNLLSYQDQTSTDFGKYFETITGKDHGHSIGLQARKIALPLTVYLENDPLAIGNSTGNGIKKISFTDNQSLCPKINHLNETDNVFLTGNTHHIIEDESFRLVNKTKDINEVSTQESINTSGFPNNLKSSLIKGKNDQRILEDEKMISKTEKVEISGSKIDDIKARNGDKSHSTDSPHTMTHILTDLISVSGSDIFHLPGRRMNWISERNIALTGCCDQYCLTFCYTTFKLMRWQCPNLHTALHQFAPNFNILKTSIDVANCGKIFGFSRSYHGLDYIVTEGSFKNVDVLTVEGDTIDEDEKKNWKQGQNINTNDGSFNRMDAGNKEKEKNILEKTDHKLDNSKISEQHIDQSSAFGTFRMNSKVNTLTDILWTDESTIVHIQGKVKNWIGKRNIFVSGCRGNGECFKKSYVTLNIPYSQCPTFPTGQTVDDSQLGRNTDGTIWKPSKFPAAEIKNISKADEINNPLVTMKRNVPIQQLFTAKKTEKRTPGEDERLLKSSDGEEKILQTIGHPVCPFSYGNNTFKMNHLGFHVKKYTKIAIRSQDAVLSNFNFNIKETLEKDGPEYVTLCSKAEYNQSFQQNPKDSSKKIGNMNDFKIANSHMVELSVKNDSKTATAAAPPPVTLPFDEKVWKPGLRDQQCHAVSEKFIKQSTCRLKATYKQVDKMNDGIYPPEKPPDWGSRKPGKAILEVNNMMQKNDFNKSADLSSDIQSYRDSSMSSKERNRNLNVPKKVCNAENPINCSGDKFENTTTTNSEMKEEDIEVKNGTRLDITKVKVMETDEELKSEITILADAIGHSERKHLHDCQPANSKDVCEKPNDYRFILQARITGNSREDQRIYDTENKSDLMETPSGTSELIENGKHENVTLLINETGLYDNREDSNLLTDPPLKPSESNDAGQNQAMNSVKNEHNLTTDHPKPIKTKDTGLPLKNQTIKQEDDSKITETLQREEEMELVDTPEGDVADENEKPGLSDEEFQKILDALNNPKYPFEDYSYMPDPYEKIKEERYRQYPHERPHGWKPSREYDDNVHTHQKQYENEPGKVDNHFKDDTQGKTTSSHHIDRNTNAIPMDSTQTPVIQRPHAADNTGNVTMNEANSYVKDDLEKKLTNDSKKVNAGLQKHETDSPTYDQGGRWRFGNSPETWKDHGIFSGIMEKRFLDNVSDDGSQCMNDNFHSFLIKQCLNGFMIWTPDEHNMTKHIAVENEETFASHNDDSQTKEHGHSLLNQHSMSGNDYEFLAKVNGMENNENEDSQTKHNKDSLTKLPTTVEDNAHCSVYHLFGVGEFASESNTVIPSCDTTSKSFSTMTNTDCQTKMNDFDAEKKNPPKNEIKEKKAPMESPQITTEEEELKINKKKYTDEKEMTSENHEKVYDRSKEMTPDKKTEHFKSDKEKIEELLKRMEKMMEILEKRRNMFDGIDVQFWKDIFHDIKNFLAHHEYFSSVVVQMVFTLLLVYKSKQVSIKHGLSNLYVEE